MKMKKINYIFILFAALFCSCNEIPQPGSETEITLPTNPYIYFDAAINSRASLVSGSVLSRNFAVYGYTYAFNNNWETYRVTAKPNVFDNVPQRVTHNSGSYIYDPVKEWQGGKYTFFAYYPTTLDHSGSNVEGTPYLTYAPDFNDAGTHLDVMTAMFEDTSLSSSPYVYFDFYHRLSAVDVVALNFYEHSYDDPNAENTVITEKATIEVIDLSLQFENVQYKEARIYMDRRMASDRTPVDPNTQPFYQIYAADSGYALSINYNNDATQYPVTAANNASMIFIPQENTDLKVTTNVSYKIRVDNEYETDYLPVTDKDGNIVTDTNGNTTYVFSQSITTPFNQSLKEGSRYYIQMTFTSSAVSINIITSEEWDEKPVDYEFE